jgi:peptide/nickel transport system ATP-binding protein
MVTQSAMNALNPVASVQAQICDVLEVHEGLKGPKAAARAKELVELVGIDISRLGSYPHELSGGMRQRVVIAMALALNPKLLIMDEPTTALDVIVEREILSQISELREKLGFSIMFISHDLSLMQHFCTHLGILYAGRLVESAACETVFARPRHPYTQGLLKSLPVLGRAETKPYTIPGNPPDPRSPPSGCRFHPRCSASTDVCKQTAPKPTIFPGEHVVRCHVLP